MAGGNKRSAKQSCKGPNCKAPRGANKPPRSQARRPNNMATSKARGAYSTPKPAGNGIGPKESQVPPTTTRHVNPRFMHAE